MPNNSDRKNAQHQKEQQASDAAAATIARLLDQQEKSDKELEKKRKKEDEDRRAKLTAEEQSRGAKDAVLLQQDALNNAEAEKQLRLQGQKVIERNVNRAKDIPEPAQFRAIARLHRRAEVIMAENKRFVYQVMNWKTGKKLAIYEANRTYRETLERNENDHIKHVREMEDLTRAADRNLAMKDAAAEYKAAIATAQAEYDNEVATDAGNPNAQNVLSGTIREIAEGLEREKKANRDQRVRDRNKLLDAIEAENKRYAATIGDAEKLLDEKTKDIEKRYKAKLRHIYERRRRTASGKPYNIDKEGAPDGVAVEEYISLINDNEPEGRAIEAARKSVKASHAYIKKLIGKAPWIERLAVGKVLSFNKDTHRCTVQLGSMPLYEVDDVCTTQETTVTVDKIVTVTKATVDDTGKVTKVEEVPEIIKEQQTITDTVCHPEFTITSGGNIVISDVMYGASNPKVGESYTVHIPAVYKDQDTHLDAGRPWIKVPEGGKALFYATEDGFTVKRTEWPLPTLTSKIKAAITDVCTFDIAKKIERTDGDANEFDSNIVDPPQFIGVDGLGNVWASHNYTHVVRHHDSGGIYRIEDIRYYTFQNRSRYQCVSNYGEGKRSAIFEGDDGIAPVAVNPTPGFSGLISVPLPTKGLQPRPFYRKHLISIGFDSWICGHPSNGGSVCDVIYKGHPAPDGFSHRCRDDTPSSPVHSEVVCGHLPDEGKVEGGQMYSFWNFSDIYKYLEISQGKITVSNEGLVQNVTWIPKGRIQIDGEWLVFSDYFSNIGFVSDDFTAFPGDEPASLANVIIWGPNCMYVPPECIWTAAEMTSADGAARYHDKVPIQETWYSGHTYRLWTEINQDQSTTSRFRVGIQKYADPLNPIGPRVRHPSSSRIPSSKQGERNRKAEKDHYAATFGEDESIKASTVPGWVRNIWGCYPREEGRVFALATWNPIVPYFQTQEDKLITMYSEGDINGGWVPFPKGGEFEFYRLIAASPDAMDMLVEDTSGPITGFNERAPGKFWQTVNGGNNWDRVEAPANLGNHGFVVEVQ